MKEYLKAVAHERAYTSFSLRRYIEYNQRSIIPYS